MILLQRFFEVLPDVGHDFKEVRADLGWGTLVFGTSDADGACDVPFAIVVGEFGGEIPGGEVIGADDGFDAIQDGVTSEHLLVIRSEAVCNFLWEKVVVGFSDDVLWIAFRRGPVDERLVCPQEGAVVVLDPALNTLQVVHEL